MAHNLISLTYFQPILNDQFWTQPILANNTIDPTVRHVYYSRYIHHYYMKRYFLTTRVHLEIAYLAEIENFLLKVL